MSVLYLITAAAILYGGWRLSLRVHPYARCFWCRGNRGRNAGSSGKRWGNCSHCGGSGRRLRWGAKG